MVPRCEQLGSVDLTTWRVVPGEANHEKEETGVWAIAGGDGDDYSLYVEVLDAERPREVAGFIVDAVTGHAHRLRLEGALAEVERERRRQRAEDDALDPSSPHLVEVAKLAGLVEQVGGIGREFGHDRFHTGREDLDKRLYSQLTQVAATAVAWMESILARTDADADIVTDIATDTGTGDDARADQVVPR
ncbi:hypothetical protein [Streptosporangium sp. V21-05]|uniref:hypothetical protein n=1 Tax=Streptosporangium sp. V21-05 TaxID=3446115 RepID=UPI003F52D69F